MFAHAYVILPFSDIAPDIAIRSSLARFQRGGSDDLPKEWITFEDETEDLRLVLDAKFIFTLNEYGGIQIEGENLRSCYCDINKIRHEMQLRKIEKWHVRFGDLMDLDTFFDRFGGRLVRHADTGAYGYWRNPLGHWDWWDLGGRFDGFITLDRNKAEGRKVSKVSSGDHIGRRILSCFEGMLGDAFGQHRVAEVDVRNDRNIELAETVLADVQADPERACPATLVLPPGSLEDHLRWLDTWRGVGPDETFIRLGLTPDASWSEVVEASCQLFRDHWIAGITYHH